MNTRNDNRTTRRWMGMAAFAAAAVIAAPAFASVPVTMTQQGRLLDDGEPLTGSQNLEFSLYDSATGGDLLWSDELTTELDGAGVYSVVLGSDDNPIDATVLQDGQVYLGLTVNGEAFATRTPLTSVPFAALAQSASVAHAVAEGAITADALAAGSVTSGALAPGAVTSDSLAEGAVTSSAIDSINWDQIVGVPSDLGQSSDTLAELSCDADQVALYDGSSWTCGDLSVGGSSYTAGSGLSLSSDGEFSLANNAVVRCNGNSFCPTATGRTIHFNGDTDGVHNITADSFCLGSLCTHYLKSASEFRSEGRLWALANFLVDGNARLRGDTTVEGNLSFDRSDDEMAVIRFREDGALLAHSEANARFTAVGTNTFRFGEIINVGTGPQPIFMNVEVVGEIEELSDERYKSEFLDLQGVLPDVLALQPMRYLFGDRSQPTFGFRAQEVAEIFPEIAREDKDGNYLVRYASFSVLAIQAIQEQQEIIDAQAGFINDLERDNQVLHDQLQSMEERLQRLESRL